MTEAELIRIIKRVVKQEMAPILMALVNSNESNTRSTLQRFATDSPTPNVRSIQPFGLSSRAPIGMDSLMLPINGDPTNQTMIGQYDKNKPTCEDGESILYNAFGQMVYLSDGKIQIGSKSANQNLVLGQIFKTFADSLLSAIATHTHPGIGFPPSNAATFTGLKASPIDDEAILSQENFTE